MALVSLRCPSCGADIELDEKREFGFCSYCGTKVMMDKKIVELKGKVTVEGVSTVDKLLERARILVEDKEYTEAESYYNKVLELEPKCAKAYWGKMLCEYRIPYAKTAEIREIDITQSKNYKRAVMYATGKQKEKYIEYGEKAAGTYGAKEQAEINKQKKAIARSRWFKVIFAIAPIATFLFLFILVISDANVIPKIITALIGVAWLFSCIFVRKELKQNIGTKSSFKWTLNNLWSVVAGLFIIICVFLAFFATPKSERTMDENTNVTTTTTVVTTTEPTTEAPVEISVSKLIKAYEDNEINANNKYKDKKIKLSGYVDDISQSEGIFSESYYIYLDNGEKNSYDRILCSLSEKSVEKAAKLKKGDKIIIEGRCNGFSGLSISVSNCEIVD